MFATSDRLSARFPWQIRNLRETGTESILRELRGPMLMPLRGRTVEAPNAFSNYGCWIAD
eukprot:313458-Alexandrium_andersonii.AAC.1